MERVQRRRDCWNCPPGEIKFGWCGARHRQAPPAGHNFVNVFRETMVLHVVCSGYAYNPQTSYVHSLYRYL